MLDDAGIGELDHRLGCIEEEPVDILHDEVGGRALLAQRVRAVDAEQLQPDPAHAAQIGIGRAGIAGKAHPGLQPFMREEADTPRLGHVGMTLQPAMRDAVQLAKDRALRGGRVQPGIARLSDIDEHFGQPFGGLIRLVETFRGRKFLIHARFPHPAALLDRLTANDIPGNSGWHEIFLMRSFYIQSGCYIYKGIIHQKY